MFWLPKKENYCLWLDIGYFDAHFGSQEGTVADVLALKRDNLQFLFFVLLEISYFDAHFGSQEVTFVHI